VSLRRRRRRRRRKRKSMAGLRKTWGSFSRRAIPYWGVRLTLNASLIPQVKTLGVSHRVEVNAVVK
jgi:hypothetical protein